jgi:hypothetical protein
VIVTRRGLRATVQDHNERRRAAQIFGNVDARPQRARIRTECREIRKAIDSIADALRAAIPAKGGQALDCVR